jgi:hypothetical protein
MDLEIPRDPNRRSPTRIEDVTRDDIARWKRQGVLHKVNFRPRPKTPPRAPPSLEEIKEMSERARREAEPDDEHKQNRKNIEESINIFPIKIPQCTRCKCSYCHKRSALGCNGRCMIL